MAIIKDPNDDQLGAGTLGSQAVGTVSGGAAGNPAAGPAAPQAKGSGNFVNLSRYMTANQGNEAVGNSVNDINKIGNDAQSQFKGAKEGFDSLSVNGPKDLDTQNRSFLNSGVQAADRYNATDKNNHVATGGAYTNLGSVGGDVGNGLNQARGAIDQIRYNGPSSGDVNSTFGKLSDAKGSLDSANKTFATSPEGVAARRQTLVDSNSQRAAGNYGAGAGNLDSLLVENRGRDTFNLQREALGNLASNYDHNAAGARATSLAGQANDAQKQAESYKSQYGDQFNNIRSTWNTALDNEAKSQAANAASRNPAIAGGDLENGGFAGNWRPRVNAANAAELARQQEVARVANEAEARRQQAERQAANPPQQRNAADRNK